MDQDNKRDSKKKVVKEKVQVKYPRTSQVVSKHVNGFGEFLREYGVVGLAVGFVFGAQVKTVVDQFTASLVDPLLGLILPGKGSLVTKTFTLHLLHKSTIFAWGALVDSLISFILIAVIIYYTVKLFKLDKLVKK